MLQLTLSQAAPQTRQPVAVVLTSKRPGAEAVAPKIAQRVADYFKREQVIGLLDHAATTKELKTLGFSDPRSCQGTRACVSKLAVLLGANAVVVSVDVGKVGKTLAIHLEAVAADREASLAMLDVSASLTEWSDAMSAPIVVFVRDVKAGLSLDPKSSAAAPAAQQPSPGVEPPLVLADAPRKVELAPQPSSADVQVVVPGEPGKPPKVAAWVFAGGAALFAGGAVAAGVMSGDAKRRYDDSLVTLADGSQGSTLTQQQAQQLADQANVAMPLAIASGAVSAGLTALATWFFLKD